MSCRTLLFFTLLLGGCAAAPSSPVHSNPPTTAPATQHIVVPPGKLLITFEKFDCFCHLSGVEQSVLELPTVTGLDWEVTEYKLWLSVKEPAPTDEQLQSALIYSGVKIARIDR